MNLGRGQTLGVWSPVKMSVDIAKRETWGRGKWGQDFLAKRREERGSGESVESCEKEGRFFVW